MQASSRSRATPVRYRYRQAEAEEDDSQQRQSEEGEASEAETYPVAQPALSTLEAASSSWFDQVNSAIGSACSAAINSIKQQPQLSAAVAAGLTVTAAAVGLILAVSKRNGSRSSSAKAGGKGAAAAGRGKGVAEKGTHAGASTKNHNAATSTPGPNSKVKPTKTCVPVSDGSAVVILRPIAADNSCLFNAVGYCMHHSTNRAPFLRQVVAREVSSDPQEYSAAFLGMDNAAYCSWITNPVHWGGGIELAILAAHYRREIAAWNLATGACHVFGEEKGYTKQVMVIYNGVHYDALAISASPRADPDDDITEFNPRTKRGKMILAAAQQLVKLHRKGKLSHSEQQQQKEQQEQAAKKAAAAAAADTSSKPTANGPPTTTAAAAAKEADGEGNAGSRAANGQLESINGKLSCTSCGVHLQGVHDAEAHAAATGHSDFEEVADNV